MKMQISNRLEQYRNWMEADKKRESIVVIPSYEPATVLVELALNISGYGYRLLIVDDGSGEDYDHIWEALGEVPRVRVIHHDRNRGKGAALKTAFSYIRRNITDAEYVVTMDADGQHLISDMEKVLRASWQVPENLILGSRVFDKTVPWKSRFGNKITRTVFHIASHRKLTDTQTGLRAFSSELMRRMERISGDRYEYEMNVLTEFASMGIPFREIRINTVYLDRNNSCSHFAPWKDSIIIYRNILGIKEKETDENKEPIGDIWDYTDPVHDIRNSAGFRNTSDLRSSGSHRQYTAQ